MNESKKFLANGDEAIFNTQYYIAYVYYRSGQNDKATSIRDKMYEDYKLHKSVLLRTLFTIGQLKMVLKDFKMRRKQQYIF